MSEIEIYTKKKTRRLSYVLDEMLVRRLGIQYELSSDLPLFLESDQKFKLNYSNEKLDGIPSLMPHKLLFEKRIQTQEIHITGKMEKLLAFADSSSLGFDPFAAGFYFLSLYEQYLPHRNDEHGRYASRESFVVQNQVHQIPLVEVYSEKLGGWLKEQFPPIELSLPSFTGTVTIDVDQVFALKAKGLAGTVAGLISDVLKARNPLNRIKVMLGQSRDPLDIYDQLVESCRSKEIKPIFFLQVGESSRYDQNNPAHLNAIRQKINELSIYSYIGIHPSYYSSTKNGLIDQELGRLKRLTAREVRSNRQHYLRYQIPSTFRALNSMGIKWDYSIGFHDINGFRASTCIPFRFFDLEADETLELELKPMSFMDLVLVRNHNNIEDAFIEMNEIIATVKRYGGSLISTWHPDVLAGLNHPYGALKLYESMLDQADA